MSDVVLRPDRELHTIRELEERNGAVLELTADDAFRRQPETVTIERERLLQIGDTQREDDMRGFIGLSLLRAWS